MKIEIFSSYDLELTQDAVNRFCEKHDVLQIQFSADKERFSVMVIYDEDDEDEE